MRFSEDNLQMQVSTYLDLLQVLWCHVANERKTTKIQGVRLKKKGVKSGVPDCLIFEPRKGYKGLAIELKIKPNKPTKNQLIWLQRLKTKGWLCHICYNFDEFKSVIDKYLESF